MGKVIEIAVREESRGPMEVLASAKVSFAQGIGDDSRGRIQNDRQVTIMTKESWDAVCEHFGRKLHWTLRRANILVEGIDLENSAGKTIQIGNFRVQVTKELKPCERMDEQFIGLTEALVPNWRGGVACKLLSEGLVNEGDRVAFVE